MTRTLLVPELVLEPGGIVRAGVGVELDGATIAGIVDAAGAGERADVVRMPGRMLIPGLVNGHSHAFQRHLRGRVEEREPSAPDDDFWSWRDAMYTAAEALDPRGVRAVAEECFDAGRRAGYTAVGEFHYVHHRPDGTPYEEPNELALQVIDAARAVGVRIVLLLAAYARGGAGQGPSAAQRRFCDPTVGAYLDRVDRLAAAVAGDPLVTVGYAPHSLRAVRTAATRCTSTPASSRARSPSRSRSSGCDPSSTSRTAASWARGRRSCTRRTSPTTSSTCSRRQAPRCAHARRRRPTSAMASCPPPAPTT